MPEVHAGVVWHIRPKQPDGIPELMIGAIQ